MFHLIFFIYMYVYVLAREGVKFGINFTSCSENGNEIARSTAEYYFCHHCYNKWNLSQNFTPACAITN